MTNKISVRDILKRNGVAKDGYQVQAVTTAAPVVEPVPVAAPKAPEKTVGDVRAEVKRIDRSYDIQSLFAPITGKKGAKASLSKRWCLVKPATTKKGQGGFSLQVLRVFSSKEEMLYGLAWRDELKAVQTQ